MSRNWNTVERAAAFQWCELEELLSGVRVTFSRNCSSGFGRCECWRCRRKRDEPLDSEIEKIAETQSKERQKELRKMVIGK